MGRLFPKDDFMKIPKPKKTKAGSWYIQLMVDGQRINRTFDTKEEAVYWAAGIKTKAAQDARAPRRLTVGEAVDKYIEAKDAVLSPSTIYGYKKMKKACFDDIAHVQLQDLTQDAVQRWVNKLSKDHAPKTVHNAHGLLSAVLDAYMPSVRLRTTLPQKQRHEITIPSKAELGAILEAAKGGKYELPILLAVWLGLRKSEIIGLKWSDIEGDYLHVRRAVVLGEDGPVEKGTKTYSGTRTVHIPAELASYLAELPRDREHIVNLSGEAIYEGFRRVCERAGVPHYRFHDLRHVNASAMLAAGIPSTYSKQRMGHSTDHMLKTVYYHTIKEEEQAYDQKIEAYLADIVSGKPAEAAPEKSEMESEKS